MAKSVVAFDAGSSLLKMGVFSVERNRIQLVDFDVSPLSVPSGASLDERKRILARQMKATLSLKKAKANDILVSISGQSVFTRFVKLPAVEEAKVSQIIKYEAQQQVPFPIEDVEWDHYIIGKTPTGEIDIVLVAVKSDIISSLVRECSKAGLEVSVADVAPLCVYNCLRHAEQEFAECTAVIDFGARAANLIISEGDDLWARTIPIGGDNITSGIAKELSIDQAEAEKLKETAWVPISSGGEAEDATEQQRKATRVIGSFIDRMSAELSRSIGFYRSQPGHSAIKRILLCGGSSRLKNFKESLSERFKVDVSWLSPLGGIGVSPGIDRQELNRFSDLLAGVVGLGLRGAEMGRIRVNLLPKAIAIQKELSKKKVLLTAAGWLLVASLLLMAFQRKISHGDNSKAFNSMVKSLAKTVVGIVPRGPTLKEELENLKSVYDQDSQMAARIDATHRKIQEVEKKIDAIETIVTARLYWAQFIEDLKNTKIEVAGRGQKNYIWLTSLRITTSPGVISQYMPAMTDTDRAMFMAGTYRGTLYGPSTRKSTTRGRKAGAANRPWVVITGYVKIPPQVQGKESEATARAEALMKALEVMGERFVCRKGHRYREDRDTGVLYPVSAETGPARAYRFRWDENANKVVVEGLVRAGASNGKGGAGAGEEWQVLATYKSRKKPDWLVNGHIQGEDADFPCPIELAEQVQRGSKGRAKTCKRTPGYLDEVQVRWLELKTTKLARFTIVARFADEFEYPKKSKML